MNSASRAVQAAVVQMALLSTVCLACAEGSTQAGEKGGATMEKGDTTVIRTPAVAGQFYPASAPVLSQEVDQYIAEAPRASLPGTLVGLIAPHAGYVYSGVVAAHAYRLLDEGQFKTAVVLAPSHRVPFQGASVYIGDGYQTPLGIVPINKAMSQAIVDRDPLAIYRPEAHRAEHSLEVQVPFLQRTLGEFQLVAVVMGRNDVAQCQALARSLAEVIRGNDALLVASTDLSHYHPHSEAVVLDAIVQRYVRQFDPEGLLSATGKGVCEACGAVPMATVMMAARELGATGAAVLKYATSGDVVGDRSAVVGYMAAALYAGDRNPRAPKEWSPLSAPAKQELLRLAREAIAAYLDTGTVPRFEPSIDELRSERGVFVTLTIDGQLRGCIGHHEPDAPLFRLVPQTAVAAAFRDPRFPPLTEEELRRIHIKISAYLTPVYSIQSPQDYEPGVHGIILEKGGRAATFLPEVPIEQGWDREATFEHLCRKAYLPPGAWQEGCTFHVYKTEVFEEEQ